jgi:flagellar basal body rod protein FlgC
MRKALYWLAGSLLFLLLLIIAASFLADEPMRKKMEADLNQRLKGYSVRVGRLDFHPIGLSLELGQSTIYQNAHPDPPVAEIPYLSASIHWRALLFGKLVADFEIDRPKIHFDLSQFTQEAKDEVPIKDKGWQEALEAIYPLKINRFAISNADLTYIDKGPFRPLRVTRLNFVAENIRNVESAQGTYSSPVHAQGIVFDHGKATLDGKADFLAEPHVAIKADIQLEQIDVDYFKPIAERYKFTVQKGVLSSNGSVEYARQGTTIQIRELRLDNVVADYIHDTPEAPTKKIAKEAGKTARKYSNEPTLEVKVDRLRINRSQLGYVNHAATPAYRVFFSDANLDIENFSNHFKNGVARGRVKGRFMGSGPSEIDVAFRPESKGPDFNISTKIENTDMRTMNNLFRAYGNFDVVRGNFSFYSELTVRQGKVDGYVKPLFRDMDVYDARQDRDKSLFRKLYEGLIGGLSSLLSNTPRQEVATQTTVSGDIESPQTSTWETVLRLIQNAFFKTILPGFEKQVARGKGEQRPG